MKKPARIIVVGDVMLDRYFWGEISRISPEVPVPVCSLRDTTFSLGGAANVAHNLVNLGAGVTLMGVVGEDAMASQLRALLEEKGIAAHLLSDSSRPTTVKTRVIGNSQHVVRIDEERVAPLGPAMTTELVDALTGALSGAAAVILSDYAKGTLLEADTCRAVIAACKDASIPVLVDPKSPDWERYRGAACITPNRRELVAAAVCAAGVSRGLEDDARLLMERTGAGYLLVTLGPEGMRLFSAGEDRSFASTPREVYDVSGAGDTVIATFAASMAAGLDAFESARRANAAAGIVVGKVGTYPVSSAELDEALGAERRRTDKVCSLDEALHKVAFWRGEGKRVVFTNGCFDLLHAGHVLLFQEARKLGDRLVVAINSDASVRRIKGDPRPILHERERVQILSALEHVDMLLVFDDDEPLELIERIRPDVLAKGSDYAEAEVVGAEVVRSHGGEVALVPVLENTSVTDILKKLKGAAP